jgi:hypothetical protein
MRRRVALAVAAMALTAPAAAAQSNAERFCADLGHVVRLAERPTSSPRFGPLDLPQEIWSGRKGTRDVSALGVLSVGGRVTTKVTPPEDEPGALRKHTASSVFR